MKGYIAGYIDEYINSWTGFTLMINIYRRLQKVQYLIRRDIKKLRKFGQMSKLGVLYLPFSLVWTKISLDKHSSVHPTYLPKKFGHFGIKVCSISNFSPFVRNLIKHNF